MLDNLADNAAAAAAYSALGILLMVVGFVAVDIVTPGKLREQVWTDRNRNASILVAANLVAVAIIVVGAIVASEGNLGEGLVYTLVYSTIGIALMLASFVVLDLLTPGSLGELLVDEAHHPAVWVSAALQVGSSVVIAAAIL